MSSTKTFTDAKESIEDMGRSAGEKLDGARDQTAGALHTAASSVRKTGRQGSEAIDGLATGAADRLEATASYLDNHDLQDALNGLRSFARGHLRESLVFAVAVGFLAGAALNRAAHTCRTTPEGA